jgi:uncharacterized membrane protein YoaK (UPF0700 family)
MSPNVTQLAIDLAMLARCFLQPTNVRKIRSRADVTTLAVLGFVVGVVAGAILEIHFELWSIAFPLGLAVLSIPLGETWDLSSADQT